MEKIATDTYSFEDLRQGGFVYVDMGSCQAATVEKLWEKIGDLLISEAERLGVTLLPLLYQTGYLTIKGDRWDGGDHLYRLGFPNFDAEMRNLSDRQIQVAK